jgi:hypothetical protein
VAAADTGLALPEGVKLTGFKYYRNECACVGYVIFNNSHAANKIKGTAQRSWKPERLITNSDSRKTNMVLAIALVHLMDRYPGLRPSRWWH